ncbi:MAG: hypothetical protein K0Q78_268 [Cellvibrio sp.]|nr:hypothetical protein [Cellvibrio sp.]
MFWLEHHALAIFTRVDAENRTAGNVEIIDYTAKARVKRNGGVIHKKIFNRSRGNIQDDLAIFIHVLLWYLSAFDMGINQNMWGAIVVQYPFIDSAQKIRTTGRHGHKIFL